MMLFCVFSYAQTTVTGSVTDRNSQPLSGATIVIVGTSTCIITFTLLESKITNYLNKKQEITTF